MTILRFYAPTFQTTVFCVNLWLTSEIDMRIRNRFKSYLKNKPNFQVNLAVLLNHLNCVKKCTQFLRG